MRASWYLPEMVPRTSYRCRERLCYADWQRRAPRTVRTANAGSKGDGKARDKYSSGVEQCGNGSHTNEGSARCRSSRVQRFQG